MSLRANGVDDAEWQRVRFLFRFPFPYGKGNRVRFLRRLRCYHARRSTDDLLPLERLNLRIRHAENLAEDFAIVLAQHRLGPGRIHHCMRWLGQSRRAFDMLCERAVSRYAHGSMLAEHGSMLAKHGSMLAEHGAKLDAQGAKLAEVDWKLDHLSSTVAEQGTKLDELLALLRGRTE